uniref:Actin-related protein 2/3 complex subunit 1B n=1 Tax=Arundo donax TaxID=35708 RepID=A0A0A9ESN9_ARUDO
MPTAIHQFAECITCHAWSPDQSSLSLSLSLSLSALDLTVPFELLPTCQWIPAPTLDRWGDWLGKPSDSFAWSSGSSDS